MLTMLTMERRKDWKKMKSTNGLVKQHSEVETD